MSRRGREVNPLELQHRPKLNIKKSGLEIVLDLIGIVSFMAICIYCIYIWPSLPDSIPTHYNFKGEADSWGGKGSLLILPLISLILWIGLTALERYPHVHNYNGLTEENAERLYKNSRMMLNVMKNEMVIAFVFFTWKSVQDAFGKELYSDEWELPVFLIVVFGSTAFFVVRSFRLR